MDGWEVSLQGGLIVLDLTDGVRTISRAMTVDEADELAQALNELVIEADLDGCDEDADGPYDDEDEEAA